MSRLRLFILPKAQRRWTIRCSSRRIGAFGDPIDAVHAAIAVASVEEVRGHAVEVLHQDVNGRWLLVPARSLAARPQLQAPVLPLP